MSTKEIAEQFLEDMQPPVVIIPMTVKEVAEKCYAIARAYLELEKEKARLILHIDDIEKCNDNCQAKIASLESEITKLKKSREWLRNGLEFYSLMSDHKESAQWFMQMDRDRGNKAREALKSDDELMNEGE